MHLAKIAPCLAFDHSVATLLGDRDGLLALVDGFLYAVSLEVGNRQVPVHWSLPVQVALSLPDGQSLVKFTDAGFRLADSDVRHGNGVAQVRLAVEVPDTACGFDPGQIGAQP